MNPKTSASLIAALIIPLFLTGVEARAQSSSVVATGLQAPSRVLCTSRGNILVAESGLGPNAGRVSIVDAAGVRRTLIDGLPAGIAPPDNAPSGPSGLALRGRTLYVTIGGGDATVAGTAPGSAVPNLNPSSPILSSVLAVKLGARVERATAGFTLTAADHAALKNGETLKLKNSSKDKITVRLVADFPDYVAEPRPDQPDNVRLSNPFGIAFDRDRLYVVDASLNRLVKVDARTGEVVVLTTFGPLANPLPFGPPTIDFVPDSVRLSRGSLLVTNLTGFPFPRGAAGVRRVDPTTGAEEPLVGGLSSAIDIVAVDGQGGASTLYVLEFSADMLATPAAPGRLLRFDSPTAEPTVISSELVTPTGLDRDPQTGDLFLTEFFTGRVIRITGA